MITKRFTLLQLMNVIENRVTTANSVDDAKAILGHLFNTSVTEPEVGYYINELKRYNPLWLMALRHEIRTLKLMYFDEDRTSIFDFRSPNKRYQDFITIIGLEFNYYFDIPQLDLSK
jgi:hypothetical protein